MLKGTTNEEKIWNYLVEKIGNKFGVAGLMGNLQAESGFSPINLQNSFNKKLNISDEDYTMLVDNNNYPDFVKDSAGYGLAQWTYYTRKQNLLDFARARKSSIGDLEMQLDFLMSELLNGYKGVLNGLKSASSVKEASDIVITQFERPKDQSDTAKNKRASLGQAIYDKYIKEVNKKMYERQKVVDLVKSWDGKKESDGSYKSIIDIYNSVGPFPRSTKMQYGWAWCACTWSALAKKLGYTEIMPVEISCREIIKIAQSMGIWVENDSYVPKPGDAILYDWEDNGVGDNTGNPDHIGTVIEVYGSYMVIEEGNYSDSVKRRTVSLNGKFIRGFITPKYTNNTVSAPKQESGLDIETVAREVIAGKWGTGLVRKANLEKAGYKYDAVQKKVNETLNGSAVKTQNLVQDQNQPVAKKVVSTCTAKCKDTSLKGTYITTADLYLRNDAGTDMKALVVVPKGTEVKMYGYYNMSNGVKWYYVQTVIDGVEYIGFQSSAYLKKK